MWIYLGLRHFRWNEILQINLKEIFHVLADLHTDIECSNQQQQNPKIMQSLNKFAEES